MKTKPAMKINYVRVYQDVTDEKQKVGCSTPERPTRKYIKANENLYKREGDVSNKLFFMCLKQAIKSLTDWFVVFSACWVKLLPHKPVQQGRGRCNPSIEPSVSKNESCGGGERGTCTLGQVCECKAMWTGPHCLAPNGFDEIAWEIPDSIGDLEIDPPLVIPRSLSWGLSVLVLMLLYTIFIVRPQGWSSIPDVKKVYLSVAANNLRENNVVR